MVRRSKRAINKRILASVILAAIVFAITDSIILTNGQVLNVFSSLLSPSPPKWCAPTSPVIFQPGPDAGDVSLQNAGCVSNATTGALSAYFLNGANISNFKPSNVLVTFPFANFKAIAFYDYAAPGDRNLNITAVHIDTTWLADEYYMMAVYFVGRQASTTLNISGALATLSVNPQANLSSAVILKGDYLVLVNANVGDEGLTRWLGLVVQTANAVP